MRFGSLKVNFISMHRQFIRFIFMVVNHF